MLDNVALKDLWKIVVTPAAKRNAVAHLMDAHEMSERRPCKAIGCCRMTIRYQTSRADDAAQRQIPVHRRRRNLPGRLGKKATKPRLPPWTSGGWTGLRRTRRRR